MEGIDKNNSNNYSYFYNRTEIKKEIIYSKNEKYKNPLAYPIFKKLFGNKIFLIDFLNSVLKLKGNEKITNIEYLDYPIIENDNEINKITNENNEKTNSETKKGEKNREIEKVENNINKKFSVVGLRCYDNKQKEYEIQIHKEKISQIRDRCNTSKKISSYSRLENNYNNNRNICYINILDYILFYPEKDIEYEKNYYHFSYYEEEDRNLKINGLEYIYIELPRFNRFRYIKEDEKRLRYWQAFFTSYNIETKQFDLLDEEFNDEIISKAVENCKLCLAGNSAIQYENFERYYESYLKKIEVLKINNAKLKRINNDIKKDNKILKEANEVLESELESLRKRLKENNTKE